MQLRWCVASLFIFGVIAAHADDKKPEPAEIVSSASFAALAGPSGSSVGGAGASSITPDLFNGAFSISAPIALPAGRGGLQPAIALNYRSNVQNGWLGVGWSFNPGTISTVRNPNPANAPFTYETTTGAVSLVELTPTSFRSELDESFAEYLRTPGTDGKPAWRVVDKAGTVFQFGSTSGSRDVDRGAKETRWYIDRVTDTNGNFISYSYVVDGNRRYLKEIDYTGFSDPAGTIIDPAPNSVLFSYEDRPDPILTYADGIARATAKRVKSITVSASGAVQWVFELTYGVSSSTGRSMLQSIVQRSHLGGALPNTTFVYNNAAVGFEADYATSLSANPWKSDEVRWSGPLSALMGYPDFNADGLQEFCVPEMSALSCWSRAGNALERPQRLPPFREGWMNFDVSVVQYPDLNLDGSSDVCAHFQRGVQCWLALNGKLQPRPGPQWDFSYIPTVSTIRYMDIDGDRYPDICRLEASGIECFPGGIGGFQLDPAKRVKGPEWKDLPDDVENPPPGTDWSDSSYYSTIRAIHLDADQRADLCARDADGVICYLADANGFDLANPVRGPAWSNPPPVVDPLNPPPPATDWKATSHSTSIQYPDLNGDGLNDVCGRDNSGIVCFLNVDGSFDLSRPILGPRWADIPQPIDDMGNPVGAPDPNDWSQDSRNASIQFQDINGDGTDDICGRDKVGLICYTVSQAAVFSVAPLRGPSMPDGGTPDWSASDIYRSIRLMDFDGDGGLDVCFRGNKGLGCWFRKDFADDRLNAVTSPLGGTTTVEYKSTVSSTQTRLPSPFLVPSKISISDGRSTISERTFTFSGGIFNSLAGQFRGFGHVTVVTTADASAPPRVESFQFLQGDGQEPSDNDADAAVAKMRGKIIRHDISDGSGVLLARTETEYATLIDGPWYFSPPTVQISRQCDRRGCSVSNRTEYDYDNSTGNQVRTIHLGNPSKEADDWLVERRFVVNPTLHISNRVAEETVYRGRTTVAKVSSTSFAYDAVSGCDDLSDRPLDVRRGNVTSITRWNDSGHDVTTTMRYDKFGNLVCSRGPDGSRITLDYDPTGTFALRTTNSLNQAVVQSIGGVNGVAGSGLYGTLEAVADANGAITSFTYDEFGRELSETHPDGSGTQFSYLNWGNPISQHTRSITAAGVWQNDFLDGVGRVWKSEFEGAAGQVAESITEFNSHGLPSRSSDIVYAGATHLWTEFRYDALDRVVERIEPGGAIYRSCYGPGVQVTVDPEGQRRRATFTAFGQIDAYNEDSGRAFDCVTESGGEARQTNFSYDVLGNATAAWSGARREQFKYDSLGRKIASRTPDSGEWHYEYDAVGRLLKQTDPSGVSMILNYDVLGRVLRKEFRDDNDRPQRFVNYTFDEGLNAIGRMTSAKDDNGRSSFIYSAAGQLIAALRTTGDETYVTHSVFDLDGRLKQLVYPDGKSVFYDYDGPWLKKVYSDSTVYAEYSNFDPQFGPLDSRYGNNTTTSVEYGKNIAGRCGFKPFLICTLKSVGPGGVIVSQNLEYDIAGNVISIDDRALGATKLFYDENYRLTSAESPAGSKVWSYDKFDNPALPITDPSVFAEPIELPSNKVGKVDNTSLAYDQLGKVVSVSTHVGSDNLNITYAIDGLLSGASRRGKTLASYDYDGDGLMVQRRTPSGTTDYVGLHYECEEGHCLRKILAGGLTIAYEDDSAAIYYSYSDYRGSVRAIAGADGVPVATLNYDLWGTPTHSEVRKKIPGVTSGMYLAFGGGALDEATALYTLGARQYSGDLRRFLQPDGQASDLGSMLRSNRYSYGFNNPATFSDPDGRLPFIVIAIIVGAVIGGLDAAFHDEDVLGGIVKGAVIGGVSAALASGVYAGTFALTDSVLASSTIAGAATGALSAAINGGDVGRGALVGAVSGFVGGGFADLYGNSITANTPTEAIAGQVGRDMLRGAAQGYVVSRVFGGDPDDAMVNGAVQAVVAGQATNAVGYSIGLYESGGKQPTWYKHGYVFKAKENMAGPGITIGIFSTVNPGPYDAAVQKNYGRGARYDRYANQLITHEQGHVSQYYALGGGYLPAYGAEAALHNPNQMSLSNNSYENSMPNGAWSSNHLGNTYGDLFGKK
ncbi:hypothetical protein FJ986_23405 [Mesorhizobium sp. B1-1-1]|uniref:SpvB/TcaC N-terminal domain-containing protein n=1 Tax=Mesorhizobium sp. B1-1-1 TaxID=2589983 RepID=UPI00112975E8|nr:SpvB/TcaC N-terminal domain-containing protein [Mesorhizobium sp. B1-1-1]TPN63600.1 hypothetical protein FJ986_23405 [Mesorhizobium sp. B1-1-1]